MGLCEVSSCCCGFITLRDGAIYWTLLDGLLNVMICLCAVLSFRELWGLLLLFTVCLDFTLAISLHFKKFFVISLCQILLFSYILCIFATAFIFLPIVITDDNTDKDFITGYLILLFVSMLVAFYYVYMWIVVNSYRRHLLRPPCLPAVDPFLIQVLPKAGATQD